MRHILFCFVKNAGVAAILMGGPVCASAASYTSVDCYWRFAQGSALSEYRWRLHVGEQTTTIAVEESGTGYSQVTSTARDLGLENAGQLDSFEMIIPNSCTAITPETKTIVSCRAMPAAMRFFSSKTGESVAVAPLPSKESVIRLGSSSTHYSFGVSLPMMIGGVLEPILFRVIEEREICQFE